MKILVPVDGSKATEHALEKLLSFQSNWREPIHITLLFVASPVNPSLAVHGVVLDRDKMQRHYDAEADNALKSAQELLSRSKVSFERATAVGEAAEHICSTAAQGAFDMIWMGTRGMGGFANLLLGSVAMKVLHGTNVPVTLVPNHTVTCALPIPPWGIAS